MHGGCPWCLSGDNIHIVIRGKRELGWVWAAWFLNLLSQLRWRTWPVWTLEQVVSSWGSARTSVSSSSCWPWMGYRHYGSVSPGNTNTVSVTFVLMWILSRKKTPGLWNTPSYYRKQKNVSDRESCYDIGYEPCPQVTDSDFFDIQNSFLKERVENGFSMQPGPWWDLEC